MSIELVPLLAAEWTESDKHIKLIGLMTITMKKNNSDQTKGKPWTESVKSLRFVLLLLNSRIRPNPKGRSRFLTVPAGPPCFYFHFH